MTTSNPVKKVWVIIVTYNGAPWIESCLHSVVNSVYPANVVVIDNCSTDNTCEIITVKFPGVLLIQNSVNKGFGAANNIGISKALKAGADFVFLLNQDTTTTEDTVGNLLRAFDQTGNQYGVLSPFHLDSKGDKYDTGFFSYLKKEYDQETIDRARANASVVILPVGFVNAAAWMVPSKVFKKIGGFAPLFFHYGEDRDFVNRLHYNALSIGVVSRSFISHYRDDRNMFVRDWNLERKARYYFVGWLSRACDINRTLISGWTDGFLWGLKESLNDLFYLRISTLLVFSKVFFQITLEVPQIINHRESVKSNENLKFLK